MLLSSRGLGGLRVVILFVLLVASGSCAARTGDMASAEENTIRLVKELGPSVVAVHVTVENVSTVPGTAPHELEGGGSGFVVDKQGHIITNFHVIAGALQEEAINKGQLQIRPDASVKILFIEKPGEEFPARVKGVNADYDLAILELEEPDKAPRPRPLTLGDSDHIEAGQTAIAIGSPFGLHSTVTMGIVSAIEREQPGLVGIDIPFIQSDAAINPGNSGGPLFNASGEVIGINNAILSSTMGPGAFVGVGFAVPVNLLKESMEGLMAGGLSGVAAALVEMPNRPRLGLTAALNVEDFPPELRSALKLPEQGVVIGEVAPNSPAERAGLIAPTGVTLVGDQAYPVGGDIIVSVDGKEVERAIHLQQIILEHKAGDVVRLKVWRDGEVREVDVRLEVVPVEPETQPTSLFIDQAARERIVDPAS